MKPVLQLDEVKARKEGTSENKQGWTWTTPGLLLDDPTLRLYVSPRRVTNIKEKGREGERDSHPARQMEQKWANYYIMGALRGHH